MTLEQRVRDVSVLNLLDRAVVVTEDETSWQDHSEGIRAAIAEGGLGLAIRRQMAFEATLDDDEFSIVDDYGEFPPALAALALEEPTP